MAIPSKLRVMISSRCNDMFPSSGGQSLSKIRIELKKEIEDIEVFGRQLFEVWINEEIPPQGGSWDNWDTCLLAVKGCDILLVLYNGDAGWEREQGGIGICHAELQAAMNLAPGKVRLVKLEGSTVEKTTRNERFQKYVTKLSLFRGRAVSNLDELKSQVTNTLADALIELAQAGVREAGKAKFSQGEALAWSRLD